MLYAKLSGTIIGMQYLQRRATQPLTRLRNQSYTRFGFSRRSPSPAPIREQSAKTDAKQFNCTCARSGLRAALSKLGDSAFCLRFGFRKIAATTGAFRGSSGPPSGLPLASKCVSCSGSNTSSGLSLGLNSKGHHVYLDKIL